MKVKDLGASAAKFKKNAGAAQSEYVSGAKAAAGDWHTAAAAAEDRWSAGTSEAAGRRAFSKGIAESSPAAYAEGVEKVGGSRFVQGVGVADVRWQKGFGPYADTLRSLSLSPKGVKGTNMGRANEVATALRARKVS